MTRRYPRLRAGKAKAVILQRSDAGLDELQRQARALPDLAREQFAATGFQKVSLEELHRLRDELESIANDAGFPERSLAARQMFDRAVAVRLGSLDLPVGECLRSDVWSWMALHLVPHLVNWRFSKDDGSIAEERFIGIIQRNALGRLWLRARVFDRGIKSPDRWGLVEAISEDAAVAILERTSVASDWRLARQVGEAWLDARSWGPGSDEMLRIAVIRVRIENSLTEFGAYDDAQLRSYLKDQFISAKTTIEAAEG